MKSFDLTRGSVFKTLVLYSLPLIATNVVQLLFHATDVAVLGIMADDAAVAAVGACGPLISLFVSLFAGLATGANILVAKCVGAKNQEDARRATGTALAVGFISGIILMAVANIWAEQLLKLINCQSAVLKDAALYLRIYFTGMPIMMLYNFVSAILRSVGDSMRPMIYMLISGVLNVGFNVLLIGGFGLTVSGVALATVIANLVSLILALIALFKNNGYCKVERKNLRIRRHELVHIVRIGVPASLGGLCFYVANLFVSSAVNSLSEEAMTAGAISGQFDSIIYNVGMSVAVACMSMVGQSMGMLDFSRIRRVIRMAIFYSTALSLSLGAIFVALSEPMLDIMTDSPAVIAIAKEKMTVLCLTYFITSIMEIFSFSLRAMGRSTSITLVCLICGFGVRAGWIIFLVPLRNTLGMIYLSFPISALCAVIAYTVIYRLTLKRRQSGKI